MIKIASQNEEQIVIGSQPIFCHTALIDRVEGTRREYRRFSMVQAVLRACLLLFLVGGLLAWADYLWVLRHAVRQTDLIVLGAVLASLVVYKIVLHRRAERNRRDTAMEIETSFPDLGQRVCTTLEYTEPTATTMPAWPSLVQALATETEERTYRLDFKQVVPWRSLRWPTVATVLLALGLTIILAASPPARIAALRLFLLPFHYTEIKIEPGDLSVKFGDEAKVRAVLSGRPVKKAELLTRKVGSQDSWTAVSLGPEDSENSLLTGTLEKTLKNCRENLEYRVAAGEVESVTYRLTILHPLLLKKVSATIVPPAYTKKETKKVDEGDISAIEGSSVRFHFELDRAAQTGRVQFTPAKGVQLAEAIPPIALTMNGTAMEGVLETVPQSLEYEVSAEASDGTKLDPRKFRIAVKPDGKPTIHILKPEAVIETLPTAEVTMHIEAKDDFGLSKAGIVFKIGDGPWETLLTSNNSDQPVSLLNAATLYLEDRDLSFQDGIVYYAFAEDNYPAGPHRVTSEMQFIDIRAFKREFAVGKPGKPGKSISLELLISRQRTNLQHTFGQCGDWKPDARIAKRLAKSERSLAKLTAEFSADIAAKFGPVPCLDQAVEEMQAGAVELDKLNAKESCRRQEQALAYLIQARENLRQLLANPKTGAEAEKLDYQAKRNMPEKPEEEEEKSDDEENLQKQIADLAEEEKEIVEELDNKSFGESKPSKNQKPSKSTSQSSGSGQPQESEQPPENSDPSKNDNPHESGENQPQSTADLAERQRQAAQKAAEIAGKMQNDEAITELAENRIADAEKAINSSEKALEQGNRDEAKREAQAAAAKLDRLARQVGALKATEMSAKMQASENLARQLAERQRNSEKSENQGKEEGKQPGQGRGQEKSDGKEKGQGGAKSKSNEKGQGDGAGQGEGQGEGGEGSQSADSTHLAERQRDEAEEARSLEDIFAELQKDASLADPDLVRDLEEAAATASPKAIADQIEKAANALTSGDREKAQREIDESAKRLDSLADKLETARHGIEQPKLEALMAAEKIAAELQKDSKDPVPDRKRSEIEKKMIDLRDAMNAIGGEDGNLRDAANELSIAMEGGTTADNNWRKVRNGYYLPPERYSSAVEYVDRAIQVRIQEIILKDVILDRDQAVPERYRKQVEEYFKKLSEDLR